MSIHQAELSQSAFARTTFYPALGSFHDKPMSIRIGRGSRWAQIADNLSHLFGCSMSCLKSIDCYWGGEYADENSVDVLVVNGEIVGSFDIALSADEWAD